MSAVATAPIVEKGYKVIADGLIVTRALSFEEWKALGTTLTEVLNRTTWAIGDWLVYGSGRGDFGEYYQEAQRITHRSYDVLSQASRVSKAFPIDARSFALPWSHYREVLRLEAGDRVMALRAAQQNGWTRDALADFINGRESTPASQRPTQRPIRSNDSYRGWQRNPKHNVTQCPQCGHTWEPRKVGQAKRTGPYTANN